MNDATTPTTPPLMTREEIAAWIITCDEPRLHHQLGGIHINRKRLYELCATALAYHDERERAERLQAELTKHRIETQAIIENLATVLMPDSPLESARAEFSLDAMGACQIIRQLRERADRLAAANAELEALFNLQVARMAEADRAWQAANPGNELRRLDLGEMLAWLLGERERLCIENKAFLDRTMTRQKRLNKEGK